MKRTTIGLKKLGVAAAVSPISAHYEIMDCLPVSAVEEAAQDYGLTTAEMAKKIGISRTTLHRKTLNKGKLSRQESDELLRHSTLLAMATAVFGDPKSAKQWLTTEQIGLGGAVPADLARTTPGYREVEKLLVRIDYGVYA